MAPDACGILALILEWGLPETYGRWQVLSCLCRDAIPREGQQRANGHVERQIRTLQPSPPA